MSTTKPQFNCRLDPEIDKEIDNYARTSGIAKGRLVENLWNFYQIRDLKGVREKLCGHALVSHDPRELSQLYLLMLSLQKILNGKGVSSDSN